jgi:nucleotide-binding universal stress UspA family protein
MLVTVWITEGTWPACVAAARAHTPPGADLVLLHVASPDLPAAAHGAFAGLLGRAHRERDPGAHLEHLAAASAAELLDAAAKRLDRPATTTSRRGRVEHEVIAAVQHTDLLILARDGDRTHPGPRSLRPPTRFVVDHAPCPVLLVWPEAAPEHPAPPPPPPPPPPPH